MSEKKLIRNSTADFLIFISELSETRTIWKFRIVQTGGLRGWLEMMNKKLTTKYPQGDKEIFRAFCGHKSYKPSGLGWFELSCKRERTYHD